MRWLITGLALSTTGMLSAADDIGLEIHGFISQGWYITEENNYLSSNSSNGTFEYTEIGLNVQAEPVDRLRIGLQIFTRQFGDFGNLQPSIDWAYGDYRFCDELSVSLGRVKLSRGFYQDIEDYDFLRPWALLPNAVYQPQNREVSNAINGIQLHGNLRTEHVGLLSYELSFGDITVTEDGDAATVSKQFGLEDVRNPDADWAFSAHLHYEPPVEGLEFVGSFLWIEDNMSETLLNGIWSESIFDRLMIWQLGARYRWGKFQFTTEYARFPWVFTTRTPLPGPGNNILTIQSDRQREGVYAALEYRVNEQWVAGTYYSVYHVDADDRDGDDMVARGSERHRAFQRDWCLNAAFEINRYWMVKGEAHLVDGTALLQRVPNGGDFFNEPETQRYWTYFVLKTSFNF